MKKSTLIAVVLFVVSIAVSLYAYMQMPERVASHWNARGEVDGYTNRFWGAFLLPLMTAGLYLLLRVVPRLDPLKANIAAFRPYYDGFLVAFVAFMLYLHILTILVNLGMRLNMLQWMAPGFGVLFYCAGVLVSKARRNWFIGIRTPWTLSSDRVWERTHALGGRLFKATGVLAFFGVLFPQAAIVFMLAPILVVSLLMVVYSYIEFRREGNPA